MSGEPGKTRAPAGWKRLVGMLIRIGLMAFVLLVLLGFIGSIWPVEIAVHLVAGPFIHGWKNLPPFVSQWRAALLPLGCLAVAIVLAHRFIRWWIASKDIRMPWRWGHTVCAASLLLLGSAAAIAMSGITHQAAWLVSSPWLEDNRKTRLMTATHSARQILMALFEYEVEHDRYPDKLDEVMALGLSPRVLWVETGPGRLPEPFIFLKPGRPTSGLIEPVLVSPVIQPGDRVAVGYSDHSVRTMPLKAWQKLAREIHAAHE
jgi:hypothetical protein